MKILGLSSYKLVQFLKNHVNTQKVERPIVIHSYPACKLGYGYKNAHKDVFIDRYEQPNIVEDYKV